MKKMGERGDETIRLCCVTRSGNVINVEFDIKSWLACPLAHD